MKVVGIIAVIVVILVLAGIWGMTAWNKIIFTFSFRGIDLSQLSFDSLTSSGETSTKLILNLGIKNNNSFSIPFKNMKVWMYYDKTVIAETSSDLASKTFLIPANGKIDITDAVNIHFNSASIKLLKEAALKKGPKVDYTVKVNVFGIALTYSDYFLFQA